MPYVEVDGALKKVACGPCIRGHRSSKCEHHDRVMIEVRKPGRPLSSCPHPPGSCTCTRVVINYTIPKNAACPSAAAAASSSTPSSSVPQTPKAGSTASTNRVTKPRQKRASTSINIAAVEKALTADENDAGVDASNESSVKNQSSSDVSPSSSHTSAADHEQASRAMPQRSLSYSNSETPNFDRSPSREGLDTPEMVSQPVADDDQVIKIEGSCCSAKPKPELQQPAKPSCCAGKEANGEAENEPPANPQPQPQAQFKHPAAFAAQLNTMYNGNNLSDAFAYGRHMAGNNNNNMPMPSPGFFNFDSTTHGQPDLAYQYGLHPGFPSVHMSAMNRQPSLAMDHDCHCGDDCACLGCAAHPQNKTTTNYIIKMNEYMMAPLDTGTDDRFTSRTPTAHNFAFNVHAGAASGAAYSNTQVPNNTPTQTTPGGFGYPQQQNAHGQWQVDHATSSSTQVTPTQEMEKLYMYNAATRSTLANGNDSGSKHHSFGQMPNTNGIEDTDYGDSADQSPEGHSPVLSPSAFYLQSLVIPGCTDTSGTCHCGDGCACIGCLTHGGHNGIPLDPVPEHENQHDQSGVQYPQMSNTDFHDATYGNAQVPHVNDGRQAFPPPQPGPMYANASYLDQVPVSHASSPTQFPVPAFAGGPS